MHTVGKRMNRQVSSEVVGGPGNQVINHVSLCELRFKGGRKLRLPAGPTHEDNEVAGAIESQRLTEILFNKR